jgi:hypothetical protein
VNLLNACKLICIQMSARSLTHVSAHRLRNTSVQESVSHSNPSERWVLTCFSKTGGNIHNLVVRTHAWPQKPRITSLLVLEPKLIRWHKLFDEILPWGTRLISVSSNVWRQKTRVFVRYMHPVLGCSCNSCYRLPASAKQVLSYGSRTETWFSFCNEYSGNACCRPVQYILCASVLSESLSHYLHAGGKEERKCSVVLDRRLGESQSWFGHTG